MLGFFLVYKGHLCVCWVLIWVFDLWVGKWIEMWTSSFLWSPSPVEVLNYWVLAAAYQPQSSCRSAGDTWCPCVHFTSLGVKVQDSSDLSLWLPLSLLQCLPVKAMRSGGTQFAVGALSSEKMCQKPIFSFYVGWNHLCAVYYFVAVLIVNL